MLDEIRSRVRSLADGDRDVRVVHLAAWDAAGAPFPEDLLWLETRLSAESTSLAADIACLYDVARLPGHAVIQADETHPFVWRRGLLTANPHFVPPERWIAYRGARLPWIVRPRAAAPRPRTHIGAFFRGRDEMYAALAPRIADGLLRRDRAVHFIDPSLRADHLRRLANAGVDVGEELRARRLEVLGWPDVYLRDSRFDADRQIALVEEILGAQDPAILLVAHMEWALTDAPGVDALVPYERRLNPILARHVHTVICTYDLDRFDARTALDALRAHPMVLVGDEIRENSLYQGPLAV
jgi:hypothetical protein